VVVQGINKRGVIKRKIGRKVTVEYKGERNNPNPTTIDFDQSQVTKL
jgi:hypothetical protein